MKKTTKLVALAMCAVTMLTAAGCTGGKKNASNSGEQKLTYWKPLTANISVSAKNYGELPYAQELMKRTGIEVEYIHPAMGQAGERFNLMIASNEMPDIVEYYWSYFPGGPDKAIQDKNIIALNDVIDKHAPNLKKLLKENPDVDRQAKTDKGFYFNFPAVTSERELRTSGGLIIRKDWLDDLGLEMPETIDEWYIVLKAFKEKKGAKAPLCIGTDAPTNGAFVGAYGILYNYYLDNDGKIKYGPAENAYKEFLKTMNKWYNEGLFDNNFSTNDAQTITANMLNGTSGVSYGGLGGSICAWMSAKKDDEDYDLAGAKYPVLNKGDKPLFGQCGVIVGDACAITTSCKNVELAAKFLDYGYSEEGHMLNNFGIEGTSYEMKDGYPEYTELIMNNPDGLSMAAALTKYSRAGATGPFAQDKRYLEQYAGTERQQNAWKNWLDTDAEKYVLPNLYILDEDKEEYATITNSINTYVNEMYVKFISGVEPIDNFDKYIANLKKMGIDKVIAMKERAYQNYLKR